MTVTTFQEFCESVEGRSCEQVDTDLRNLKALGAEFLEACQRLGVGYREMRELRTVPADERAELLQIAQSGDKSAFLDLAETMISRHDRDLQAARRATEQVTKTLHARQEVIDDLTAENARLREDGKARKNAPLPEQEAAQMDALRNDTIAAEGALQRMLATVDQVMTEPSTEAAEKAARHSLDYLVQRIVDGCMARGISVDLAERVSPVWSQPIDEMVEKAASRSKKR